jgi:hypothetical protein
VYLSENSKGVSKQPFAQEINMARRKPEDIHQDNGGKDPKSISEISKVVPFTTGPEF